ncbi:MAG: hypothetical protein J3R72DRAFT_499965 [Linnemannia gamsii]|nr:MAG: hypothetical protein J3R72DRAFT_499965 [Linnemannia gamsii]
MTAICEFIREHTSLFKGQLRTITCNNGLDSNFQEQECSEETLVEIARLLPTLQRPLSLQKVKMMSLGPGTFRWAVQEKRDLERRDGTDTAADATNSNNLRRQQEQEHGLVPVRSVTISQHNTNYADEINDIAIGFNRTLQRLSIDASCTIDQSSLRRSIHIGRGWVNLPVLRKLYLFTNAARLVLDRQLFALCPSLVRISIADQTSRYRSQDIEPCLPGHHSNLDTLSLQGWSALSFDPATLDSTPN